MKMTMPFDLRDRAGELAHRLAHQARLQAGERIAHLAFEFGLGRQRRDRVDHQHVDGAGAHQRVGDLERLLAAVGLRDQQLVDLDAELAGIVRIERMLGVDEGGDAAVLLRLGDDMQRQRGLARAFRPEDFDDAAARQAADAERDIEAERTGRDRFDLGDGALAELHHRALAEIALDLAQRCRQRLVLIHRTLDHAKRCCSHDSLLIPFAWGPCKRASPVNVCTHFVLILFRKCQRESRCSDEVLSRLEIDALLVERTALARR